MLMDFQEDNNSLPNRLGHGQRPSQQDLVLTNKLQLINQVDNVSNFCGEHMGVKFVFKTKEICINQQFINRCDMRQLTACNMMPLVDNNVALLSLFSKTVPDVIVDVLTTES